MRLRFLGGWLMTGSETEWELSSKVSGGRGLGDADLTRSKLWRVSRVLRLRAECICSTGCGDTERGREITWFRDKFDDVIGELGTLAGRELVCVRLGR